MRPQCCRAPRLVQRSRQTAALTLRALRQLALIYFKDLAASVEYPLTVVTQREEIL